jgi:hypothetical protein
MNTELLQHERLSPRAYAALQDTATQRALELRREAINVFAARLAGGLGAIWSTLRRRATTSRGAVEGRTCPP